MTEADTISLPVQGQFATICIPAAIQIFNRVSATLVPNLPALTCKLHSANNNKKKNLMVSVWPLGASPPAREGAKRKENRLVLAALINDFVEMSNLIGEIFRSADAWLHFSAPLKCMNSYSHPPSLVNIPDWTFRLAEGFSYSGGSVIQWISCL